MISLSDKLLTLIQRGYGVSFFTYAIGSYTVQLSILSLGKLHYVEQVLPKDKYHLSDHRLVECLMWCESHIEKQISEWKQDQQIHTIKTKGIMLDPNDTHTKDMIAKGYLKKDENSKGDYDPEQWKVK